MGEMVEYYEDLYWSSCDEWDGSWHQNLAASERRRRSIIDQQKVHFQDGAPKGWWRQRDGTFVEIAHMGVDHLANTVHMLYKRISEGEDENPKYNELMIEVARRCENNRDLAAYPFGMFLEDAIARYERSKEHESRRARSISKVKVKEMQNAFEY